MCRFDCHRNPVISMNSAHLHARFSIQLAQQNSEKGRDLHNPLLFQKGRLFFGALFSVLREVPQTDLTFTPYFLSGVASHMDKQINNEQETWHIEV